MQKYKATHRVALHALLIAIDIYDFLTLPTLHGAVADALSFADYLKNHLSIPQDHITVLLGKDATRVAILKALKHLEEDPLIQQGDAILIFYAGHGSQIPAPAGWEAGNPWNKIQAIVPFDYCGTDLFGLEPQFSTNKQAVPPIPDYVIGTLIDKIAKAKGDNITVIFDCCHSASGTRDTLTSNTRVRSVELGDTAYNPDIDRHILYDGTRGLASASTFRLGNSRSHILLAACKPTEKAHESNGRGHFSSALLSLFYMVSPEKLRYRDILSRMDYIPGQNPQCEGENLSRVLFDYRVQHQDSKGYRIGFRVVGNPPEQRLIVAAGSADGIAVGAVFMIGSEGSQQSALLTVSAVQQFTSILNHPPGFTLRQPTTALLVKVGRGNDFRLYVPPQDSFRHLFRQVHKDSNLRLQFFLDDMTLVNKPEAAHLTARQAFDSKKVIFELSDEKAIQHGFTSQFDPVDADPTLVAHFLGSAGHFFRMLNWVTDGRDNNPRISSQIDIEFYELQESLVHDFEETVLRPVGPNLHQDGAINLTAGVHIPYGAKIINKSLCDLFVYLFYFDYSDFSITTRYQSCGTPEGRAYDVDFPLQRDGTLTIGYGSGGAWPFAFGLRKDQRKDVGFLKFIFSTKLLDVSDIEQRSPFNAGLNRSLLNEPWRRRLYHDTWDCLQLPVIQHRCVAERLNFPQNIY